MSIELLHHFVMAVFYSVSVVGIFVVLWGVSEAIWRFLSLKFAPERLPHARVVAVMARIRERLGAQLLLGLDIFIGADIIKSVVIPSWENIAMLGAIVLIRIVMSYFLEREMERTHQSALSGRLSDSREDPPELR